MPKPIGPGVNVVCTDATECSCGDSRCNQGAIYMCEAVGRAGIFHSMFCRHAKCDGHLIQLSGKRHLLCASCFAPLDDGDTSLVEDEQEPDDRVAWKAPPQVIHVGPRTPERVG